MVLESCTSKWVQPTKIIFERVGEGIQSPRLIMLWDCNWVDDDSQIIIPSSGSEGEVKISRKYSTWSALLPPMYCAYCTCRIMMNMVCCNKQNRTELNPSASGGTKRGWRVSPPAGYYHLSMMSVFLLRLQKQHQPPLHLQFVDINLHQEEFLQHLKFNLPASRFSSASLRSLGAQARDEIHTLISWLGFLDACNI